MFIKPLLFAPMNLLRSNAETPTTGKNDKKSAGNSLNGEKKMFPHMKKIQWGLFIGIVWVLLVWGSPPLALILGMILALTFGSPIPKSGGKISKYLLQTCVVLLGFGMNLPTILHVGMRGAVFAAATIGTTLFLGYWVGKWIGITRSTSTLISAGTAICGGSAIAAVSSVISVTEGEIAVAMGTVFLLNAVSLYLFPFLGHLLSLTQPQFGVWSGVAIHDISSVVGASMVYGPQSLEVATAVKLSRTLWIIPVTLLFGWAYSQQRKAKSSSDSAQKHNGKKIKAAIPWFIGLFLVASLIRSFVPGIASWTPQISRISRAGFTVVLFLIGTGLSAETLRKVGWRAGVQGIILWSFISVASLLVILFLGGKGLF